MRRVSARRPESGVNPASRLRSTRAFAHPDATFLKWRSILDGESIEVLAHRRRDAGLPASPKEATRLDPSAVA